MKFCQRLNNFVLGSKLPDKFGVVVVRLDQVSVTRGQARGRFNEIGSQGSLTEHDLFRIEIQIFDDLQQEQQDRYQDCYSNN